MRLDDGGRQLLRHVIPVGIELDMVDEHQVFLLALYLWHDHFDVSYATTDTLTDRRPVREMLEDWTATDDVGNAYSARRGGGGGGRLRLMRRTFVPAVDPNARFLTLTYMEDDVPLLRHTVPLPRP